MELKKRKEQFVKLLKKDLSDITELKKNLVEEKYNGYVLPILKDICFKLGDYISSIFITDESGFNIRYSSNGTIDFTLLSKKGGVVGDFSLDKNGDIVSFQYPYLCKEEIEVESLPNYRDYFEILKLCTSDDFKKNYQNIITPIYNWMDYSQQWSLVKDFLLGVQKI